MVTSVRSPGGWARLRNAIVTHWMKIGVAGTALGAILLFGTYNSGQAEHYCEGPLTTQTGAGIVALSCRNPFSGTGLILASDEQGLYFAEAPYIDGSLDGGTAATGIASGSNIFDNVQLNNPRRFVSTAYSGSTIRTSGLVRVASGSYVNFAFSTTSGATTTGNDVGFIRLKWFNCSDVSSTVDC